MLVTPKIVRRVTKVAYLRVVPVTPSVHRLIGLMVISVANVIPLVKHAVQGKVPTALSARRKLSMTWKIGEFTRNDYL